MWEELLLAAVSLLPPGSRRWARTWPVAVRDGGWLVVVEELLKGTVDAEHAGHLVLQAVLEDVHADLEAVAADSGPAGAVERAAALAGLELEEATAGQTTDRLPDHEATGLLRELVATVHGAAGRPGPGGAGRPRAAPDPARRPGLPTLTCA